MPRGGYRPGSGAKPYKTSEAIKKRMRVAVEKLAKKTGKSPEDIQAEILILGKFFGKRVTVRDWNVTYANYCDKNVVKESHKTVEEYQYPSGIIVLPEIERPDDELLKEIKRIQSSGAQA